MALAKFPSGQMEGGAEGQQQSPKSKGVGLLLLSWPSGHCPSMIPLQGVCEQALGLMLSSSLASVRAHTPTQAHTASHNQGSSHTTWSHMAGVWHPGALSSTGSRRSRSVLTKQQHGSRTSLLMHTCSCHGQSHTLADLRHTKTPTQRSHMLPHGPPEGHMHTLSAGTNVPLPLPDTAGSPCPPQASSATPKTDSQPPNPSRINFPRRHSAGSPGKSE